MDGAERRYVSMKVNEKARAAWKAVKKKTGNA